LRQFERKNADWKKALQTAEAVVAKYPNSGLAQAKLGDVYKMMGFADEAVNAYQRAVKLNIADAGSWESLGTIYKEKEQFTQADFAFSQAIAYQTKRVNERRADKPDFSLWTLGNIYHSAGNEAAAKQVYLRAIKEEPRNPLPMHSIVDIYLEEGDEQSALPVATQIMLLNPNHKIPQAEAWSLLAGWYYEHKREADGYRCSVNAERLGLRP
jgi:tetratricopeptide (TPR) repeat protein